MDALTLEVCRWEHWLTVWEWAVFAGVFLEVFDTLRELKRVSPQVRFTGNAFPQHDTVYGRLVPGKKPVLSQWIALFGWLVLFIGLIGESVSGGRLRDADRALEDRRLSTLESKINTLAASKH
jgi:hypothetical protein